VTSRSRGVRRDPDPADPVHRTHLVGVSTGQPCRRPPHSRERGGPPLAARRDPSRRRRERPGPDGRVAVAREDWLRVEDAIRGPVSAAAAALERLAADLEATLPRRIPELVRRIGDHRLRTEFGYD